MVSGWGSFHELNLTGRPPTSSAFFLAVALLRLDFYIRGKQCARASATRFLVMTPKKILVLEDDAVTRKVICEILTYAGYTVIPTADASSAVRLARQEQPDLITLDIVLGASSPSDLTDGLKVGAWLKRLSGDDKRPKIIVISSIDPKSVATGVAAAHPHTFLPKPIEKLRLLAAVAEALSDSPADSGPAEKPGAS